MLELVYYQSANVVRIIITVLEISSWVRVEIYTPLSSKNVYNDIIIRKGTIVS